MNKKIKFIIALIILSPCIFLSVQTKACISKDNPKECREQQVYIDELEAQVKSLRKALDKFSAISKDEVVNIYSEGVALRNGAMQYSVLCDDLKKEFINKMNKDKNYSWVTGVSSPWIINYKVIDTKELNDNRYLVTVEFILTDSTQSLRNSNLILETRENKGKWCIYKIEGDLYK